MAKPLIKKIKKTEKDNENQEFRENIRTTFQRFLSIQLLCNTVKRSLRKW
jgi:hypothetical protein